MGTVKGCKDVGSCLEMFKQHRLFNEIAQTSGSNISCTAKSGISSSSSRTGFSSIEARVEP